MLEIIANSKPHTAEMLPDLFKEPSKPFVLNAEIDEDAEELPSLFSLCNTHPNIPCAVENVTFDKASAPGLQQAKPVSSPPMCLHMGDADSCKDGDAGSVKSNVFNRARYKIQKEEQEQEEKQDAEFYNTPSPVCYLCPPQNANTAPVQENVKVASVQPLQKIVLEWVEKLGSVMTFMDHKGMQKTTVSIQDAASPFNGIEISIKEFSTAPKVFNIEFSGRPETIVLLEAHLPLLIASFQKGEFPFSVSRIDIGYSDGQDPLVMKQKKVQAIEETET